MTDPGGLNYEQALERLKRVVDQLERGSLGLEQSLQLFEEGISLAAQCDEKLKSVEARVKVLVEASQAPEGPARGDLETHWVKREELS